MVRSNLPQIVGNKVTNMFAYYYAVRLAETDLMFVLHFKRGSSLVTITVRFQLRSNVILIVLNFAKRLFGGARRFDVISKK